MRTRISLKKYEDLYDTFDGGHDRKHLEEVRSFAVKLAEKYCPEKIEEVYIAATLHDIGLSVSRENHENEGYQMILKDKEIKDAFSEEEYKEILEAVKEHRASTGNPQSIVAKIVSDSDKVADDTKRAMTRAYKWGIKHCPTVNHDGQLLRAAYHLYMKFGPNGTGTRLYFDESVEKLMSIYAPIFKEIDTSEYNFEKLNEFIIKD